MKNQNYDTIENSILEDRIQVWKESCHSRQHNCDFIALEPSIIELRPSKYHFWIAENNVFVSEKPIVDSFIALEPLIIELRPSKYHFWIVENNVIQPIVASFLAMDSLIRHKQLCNCSLRTNTISSHATRVTTVYFVPKSPLKMFRSIWEKLYSEVVFSSELPWIILISYLVHQFLKNMIFFNTKNWDLQFKTFWLFFWKNSGFGRRKLFLPI